jgi:excisionase family DNA binding protein
VPCPVLDDRGVTLLARWGEQLDVRHITEAGDDQELSAEQVAGYVAKYATKATEALGVTLDHRLGEGELLELDVPAHVAELVRACFELGSRPSLARLRLREWAHMLGFSGHFSTKSRRYSTTLGALRRARVAYAIRRRRGDTLPLDAWGRPEDDQAVIVVASWSYLGRGYQSTGRRGSPPRRRLGRGRCGGWPERSCRAQRRPRDGQSKARRGGKMAARTEGSTDLPDSERQTYTVRETAAVMGLSLGVTYELLRQGRLPGLRLGKRWVVPRVQLDAFLASASDRG